MRKAVSRESPVHVAGYCDHPDPLSDPVGWLKFGKLIHIRKYPPGKYPPGKYLREIKKKNVTHLSDG